MIDDIRICLDIAHEPFQEREIARDGTEKAPRRQKIYGAGGSSVRVRSVKGGRGLVVEGSFNGFLQGHNVVGSMNLHQLVSEVVEQVLDHLGMKPTGDEFIAIVEGRIKLERLDLVGYLNVSRFGGPGAVIKALDLGLAGAKANRMVFPEETLVYHSHSRYWSLMAYDKARQLKKLHPKTWAALDPILF